MNFERDALLAYMRSHRLAVVSTLGEHGEPQAALVGVAVARDGWVIFDTATRGRKHANLQRDPRIAVVFSGPGEKTLQLEGRAQPLSGSHTSDADLRAAYFRAWPEGQERALSGKIAFWCVVPHWAKFSDFDSGPLIEEFNWPQV